MSDSGAGSLEAVPQCAWPQGARIKDLADIARLVESHGLSSFLSINRQRQEGYPYWVV